MLRRVTAGASGCSRTSPARAGSGVACADGRADAVHDDVLLGRAAAVRRPGAAVAGVGRGRVVSPQCRLLPPGRNDEVLAGILERRHVIAETVGDCRVPAASSASNCSSSECGPTSPCISRSGSQARRSIPRSVANSAGRGHQAADERVAPATNSAHGRMRTASHARVGSTTRLRPAGRPHAAGLRAGEVLLRPGAMRGRPCRSA